MRIDRGSPAATADFADPGDLPACGCNGSRGRPITPPRRPPAGAGRGGGEDQSFQRRGFRGTAENAKTKICRRRVHAWAPPTSLSIYGDRVHLLRAPATRGLAARGPRRPVWRVPRPKRVRHASSGLFMLFDRLGGYLGRHRPLGARHRVRQVSRAGSPTPPPRVAQVACGRLSLR